MKNTIIAATFCICTSIAVGLSQSPEAYLETVYVDSENGSDENSGDSADQAFATLAAAALVVAESGTIHIAARDTPYRTSLHLSRGGKDGAPLTVQGNGAIIDLGRDITDGPWEQQGDEWIFMGEAKEHTRPIQTSPIFLDNIPLWIPHEREPQDLPDGALRITDEGRFAITFPEGKSPSNTKVTMTSDDTESGVFLNNGDHIVVRDLTVRFAGNDGFNVHGSGKDILFQNVRALMCGDQGISSHSTTEVAIDGAEIAFCGSRAGGIADVGESITSYHNVLLHNNRKPGMALQGQKHSFDRLVVFANKTDALPNSSEKIEVRNAAALDGTFSIVTSAADTDDALLEPLIEQAKKASEKLGQFPYPGVGAPIQE